MLSNIIKDVGFSCECCAKCCNKDFNDHVFLLEMEVEKINDIIPEVLVPAPNFDFCDNNGTFYTSGYALATKKDGNCIFLNNSNKCKIYKDRPLICRIYPYMLHREPDENGIIEWRQISGINKHGSYHNEINAEECREIADITKQYEKLYIRQQIDFLKHIKNHFRINKLRHVQSIYDKKMRLYNRGENINVMIYHKIKFKEIICSL